MKASLAFTFSEVKLNFPINGEDTDFLQDVVFI